MSVSKPPKKTTNSPNREELLLMAMDAAKAGNKDGARMMFRQILAEDKRNERAIMWMAKLADTKEEQTQWLQKALSINPDNTTARQTLDKMRYRGAARDNRTLIIFGAVAAVLIVLLLVIILLIATGALG
jgi:Tfp pilus assembly protein PilF